MKVITPDRFDAVLFDLDGVLTSTASIHSQCWKMTFDEFLSHRAEKTGEAFRPFDLDRDERQYVDGKLRYDGARSFLASRGLSLPEGTRGDPPTALTVCGIGNRKDDLVKATIDRGEVEVYAGSVALVRVLRECGIRTAVVSSSDNCERVLRAGDILDLFDARVDGVVASGLGLPWAGGVGAARGPACQQYGSSRDILSPAPAPAEAHRTPPAREAVSASAEAVPRVPGRGHAARPARRFAHRRHGCR